MAKKMFKDVDTASLIKGLPINAAPMTYADNTQFENAKREVQSANLKKEQYNQEVLIVLKSIEGNTANLAELVHLIQNNQEEKQDEMIELIKEALEIAKAQNVEEAESLYTKAIKKISNTIADAETMQKAIGWAGTVYTTVKIGLEMIK